jgi:hypothetical protein
LLIQRLIIILILTFQDKRQEEKYFLAEGQQEFCKGKEEIRLKNAFFNFWFMQLCRLKDGHLGFGGRGIA